MGIFGQDRDADQGLIRTLTDQLMDKIYDQTQLAILESRLDSSVKRSPVGFGMAGMHAAESNSG